MMDPAARDLEADPPLDRTISPIAGRLAAGGRGRALAVAGLLAGCGIFAAATWSADRPRPESPPNRPARQVVAFEPAPSAPTLTRPGPDAPSLTGDPHPVVPALEPEPPPQGAGPAPRPAGEPRAAPLMAWSQAAARPVAASNPEMVAPALQPDPPATELEQLRQGSRIPTARARRLGDRNFLILAGATLPCILQTALDSTTAGYASCLIASDVYSDNGAVVLLDRGTRVLGEYRGGLRQGRRRIFVLWTRAVTPHGVAIDLASPASDALGRGGFDGSIDTRFWDRFGAAVLLTIVDSGTAAVAGGTRDGAVRLPSDAAGLAVQGAQDIPPTLRKAQGSEVAIFAAQDFDFSPVYRLRDVGR